MTIVKRNGSSFPQLFDDFFNRDFFNWGLTNYSDTNTTIPAVNIKETAENYEVEVAAPGMSKKDFNVEMQDALSMCALELGTEMMALQNNQLKDVALVDAEIDELYRMLSK